MWNFITDLLFSIICSKQPSLLVSPNYKINKLAPYAKKHLTESGLDDNFRCSEEPPVLDFCVKCPLAPKTNSLSSLETYMFSVFTCFVIVQIVMLFLHCS